MKKNLLIIGLVAIVALLALHARKDNQPQPSSAQPEPVQATPTAPVETAKLASRALDQAQPTVAAPVAPAASAAPATNNGMDVQFTGLYLK